MEGLYCGRCSIDGTAPVVAAVMSTAEGTAPTMAVAVSAAVEGAGTTLPTAVVMAAVSGPTGIP